MWIEKRPLFLFLTVLLGKGFARGHTTSILSTEACLLEYFEAEKTLA